MQVISRHQLIYLCFIGVLTATSMLSCGNSEDTNPEELELEAYRPIITSDVYFEDLNIDEVLTATILIDWPTGGDDGLPTDGDAGDLPTHFTDLEAVHTEDIGSGCIKKGEWKEVGRIWEWQLSITKPGIVCSAVINIRGVVPKGRAIDFNTTPVYFRSVPTAELIEVQLDEHFMAVGERRPLMAVGVSRLFENSSASLSQRFVAEADFTYTSSNDAVVQIDAQGVMEAIGMGTTEITILAGDAEKSVTVTVDERSMSDVPPLGNIKVLNGQTNYAQAVDFSIDDLGTVDERGGPVFLTWFRPGIPKSAINGYDLRNFSPPILLTWTGTGMGAEMLAEPGDLIVQGSPFVSRDGIAHIIMWDDIRQELWLWRRGIRDYGEEWDIIPLPHADPRFSEDVTSLGINPTEGALPNAEIISIDYLEQDDGIYAVWTSRQDDFEFDEELNQYIGCPRMIHMFRINDDTIEVEAVERTYLGVANNGGSVPDCSQIFSFAEADYHQVVLAHKDTTHTGWPRVGARSLGHDANFFERIDEVWTQRTDEDAAMTAANTAELGILMDTPFRRYEFNNDRDERPSSRFDAKGVEAAGIENEEVEDEHPEFSDASVYSSGLPGTEFFVSFDMYDRSLEPRHAFFPIQRAIQNPGQYVSLQGEDMSTIRAPLESEIPRAFYLAGDAGADYEPTDFKPTYLYSERVVRIPRVEGNAIDTKEIDPQDIERFLLKNKYVFFDDAGEVLILSLNAIWREVDHVFNQQILLVSEDDERLSQAHAWRGTAGIMGVRGNGSNQLTVSTLGTEGETIIGDGRLSAIRYNARGDAFMVMGTNDSFSGVVYKVGTDGTINNALPVFEIAGLPAGNNATLLDVAARPDGGVVYMGRNRDNSYTWWIDAAGHLENSYIGDLAGQFSLSVPVVAHVSGTEYILRVVDLDGHPVLQTSETGENWKNYVLPYAPELKQVHLKAVSGDRILMAYTGVHVPYGEQGVAFFGAFDPSVAETTFQTDTEIADYPLPIHGEAFWLWPEGGSTQRVMDVTLGPDQGIYATIDDSLEPTYTTGPLREGTAHVLLRVKTSQ